MENEDIDLSDDRNDAMDTFPEINHELDPDEEHRMRLRREEHELDRWEVKHKLTNREKKLLKGPKFWRNPYRNISAEWSF